MALPLTQLYDDACYWEPDTGEIDDVVRDCNRSGWQRAMPMSE